LTTLTQHYQQLPACFYSVVENDLNIKSDIYLFNDSLAEEMQFNVSPPESLIESLMAQDHRPIAQAYAGHQFGNFNMLGDGRAMLLGEYQSPNMQMFDVHLKGSGRTEFSRGGDGKATLSAMLREYIYSEAMAGLGIPTTRSLAVLTTGEKISRQQEEQGAVLIRLAKSHLRVGTFEYAVAFQNIEAVTALMDFSIQRHYPHIEMNEKRAYNFLKAVINKQAKLISEWLRVGFIHGVMNTDNMTISGETIDFGPCAFMNKYDPQTCFSSIDRDQRYAFSAQQSMAKWNLCRLTECLLPLLDSEEPQAIAIAQQLIREFDEQFEQCWQVMMHQKLGFDKIDDNVKPLIEDLLALMFHHKLDYHNTFYALTYDAEQIELAPLTQWLEDWAGLLTSQGVDKQTAQELMKTVNPVVIPRNHLVEQMIHEAVELNEQSNLQQLLLDLKTPYTKKVSPLSYFDIPANHDETHQTFCGT
jgi:uncharacterized protein YdiU (UPF0061 family)